jgi:8-oxo-dGTP pyrophosphatase MutT (NUDIX family)
MEEAFGHRDKGAGPERTRTRHWMRRALAPSAVMLGSGAQHVLSPEEGGLGVGGEAGQDCHPAGTPPSLMREVLCQKKGAHNVAFCPQPSLGGWGRGGEARARHGAAQMVACAQPKKRKQQRPALAGSRISKTADLRPLQASTSKRLPLGWVDWRTQNAVENFNVSVLLSSASFSIRASNVQGVSHGIAPTASSREPPVFERGDLVELLTGVQEMTKSIKAMMRLPISPELISSVLDLAQVWQRLIEAHASLSGSAGQTAKGLQAASVKAFKYVADPLMGSSQRRAAGMDSKDVRSWGSLDTVLDNLLHVSKVYSDSAVWLYSKASELNPGQVSGAVQGISKATLDTIGLLNSQVEKLLKAQVASVLNRFDRELLGINRPNTTPKEAATCMVMDRNQKARVLRYGEAIPQLLHSAENAEGHETFYSSQMTVSLKTDDKGNLYLGPPGMLGIELPLSSDVMWTRQMAAYAASAAGSVDDRQKDEPLAPATVAAVTIPVNANGDVLLTQRAFRGMYDGMWVFPGGHVDKGESILTAAVREVREETGLDVEGPSLQPLAVWEGAVSSRSKQFCVVFFAADAMCANAQECSMELQTKEVHRAAWVSKEHLPRILDTHVLHSDLEIDGVLIDEGEQRSTRIKMAELQEGLGEGHKFALRAYLDSLDKRKNGGDKSKMNKTWPSAASGVVMAGGQVPGGAEGERVGGTSTTRVESPWTHALKDAAKMRLGEMGGGVGSLRFK